MNGSVPVFEISTRKPSVDRKGISSLLNAKWVTLEGTSDADTKSNNGGSVIFQWLSINLMNN